MIWIHIEYLPIVLLYLYIYSSKHTLIRWCAAGSYAEAAGRAVPTSTLTDRKIIFLNCGVIFFQIFSKSLSHKSLFPSKISTKCILKFK